MLEQQTVQEPIPVLRVYVDGTDLKRDKVRVSNKHPIKILLVRKGEGSGSVSEKLVEYSGTVPFITVIPGKDYSVHAFPESDRNYEGWEDFVMPRTDHTVRLKVTRQKMG